MKSSTSFAEKYTSFILVVVAVVLAAVLFTVERLDLLPLQGQATPMYGSMPEPGLHRAARSVVRKPGFAARRKALRAAQRSFVSQVRSASSASSR